MRRSFDLLKFNFEFWTSATNQHGTEKPGKPWNKKTCKGPRFKFLKLARATPGISWRIIFYWPSGAWWSFDIFQKRGVTA